MPERFTTVDELVEGVSYVAWEGGGSNASVARFPKDFQSAPRRSKQARSFVVDLCNHTLRWFAIASAESLVESRSDTSVVNRGGDGFTGAASFVGHLIEYSLLGRDLVRRHLVKPLITHDDNNRYRTRAIYQLFTVAGNTLL